MKSFKALCRCTFFICSPYHILGRYLSNVRTLEKVQKDCFEMFMKSIMEYLGNSKYSKSENFKKPSVLAWPKFVVSFRYEGLCNNNMCNLKGLNFSKQGFLTLKPCTTRPLLNKL